MLRKAAFLYESNVIETMTIASACTKLSSPFITSQLDNGADCSVTSDPHMYEAAIKIENKSYAIKGIPGSAKLHTKQVITVRLANPAAPTRGYVEIRYLWQPNPNGKIETVTAWSIAGWFS